MTDERKNWSREETILALDLYLRIPFSKATKTYPQIVQLAGVLGRTPSAVSMKIGNLARLDPELKKQGLSGLPNGSRLDEEIWSEFSERWDDLALESKKIFSDMQGISLDEYVTKTLLDESQTLPEGSDRQAIVKTRVNQDFFRSAVLAAYGDRCCITGLSVPQLLVASHIIPWSKNATTRTDPSNGLLLNSIHDKAFDSGFITITTEYKVKVSRHISEQSPDNIIEAWFTDYDGKPISLPERFPPSKKYLNWHYENIFRK